MIQVLFVCLGNICRSPLAQGIFEHMIEQHNWQELFLIDSAGTSNYHENQLPCSISIAVAKRNGIDLTTQRSRPVDLADAKQFDYLIAMDESNYHSLVNEFGCDPKKTFLVRGFEAKGYQAENPKNVPDPYGQSEKEAQKVFEILETSLVHFVEFLKKQHSLS